MTYVINNIRFCIFFLGSFRMLRTDEVDLIILKLVVSTIHIKYVICIVYSESIFFIPFFVDFHSICLALVFIHFSHE